MAAGSPQASYTPVRNRKTKCIQNLGVFMSDIGDEVGGSSSGPRRAQQPVFSSWSPCCYEFPKRHLILLCKSNYPTSIPTVKAHPALYEGRGRGEPKKRGTVIPVYSWHTLSKSAQNANNCEGSHSVRLLYTHYTVIIVRSRGPTPGLVI